LSECGLSSACAPSDPWQKRLETIGTSIPGTTVTIRNPDTGDELADGLEGEICVKGPLVMTEYLHEPEATAATFRAGWLLTGDLGSFDPDGYLRFNGRIKDMIKPGGENVSAAEVERFLLEDSRIVQAVVVGIPDDRLGEVPVAVVQRAEAAAITEEEIIGRCRKGIANFKVPRRVKVVDELPMLGSGKVDRKQLHEAFLAEVSRGASGADTR
jgi:acyl-CoA synthetase (AMP-forming)/AMP-acid ligase II